MIDDKTIIKNLEDSLMTFSESDKTQNVGWVEKNMDGIVVASGLSKAVMGERVIFQSGAQGVILNLDEDSVSIIVLGNQDAISEKEEIKTTGELLNINVSDEIIGRIIDPLGRPLDGKPAIKKGEKMPLEKIAEGVIDRSPVNTPLKTGISAIDAMIPIGRGQRELIIGDRGLGKTAIAIDTILNQRNNLKNQKKVICIYVPIGQKQSSIAQIIDRLKENAALDYSLIVAASASDPAALQYLAPYAGCAVAEYFLRKGEDVLIVYDDLTKHAWTYRQISLILKRPAGREAYPGDIFYLHSRLLERACKLNKEKGGGSITALPIIETQANDISAYIPTNVISITDGQIYLQSDLFNSGIRPAINVGNSVSRVGGSAQTSAMKSVAGKLRLDLAQYAALAIFSQFGSELDQTTIDQLEKGKRVTEVLKQPQYLPLEEAFEILTIWPAVNGFLNDIPVEKCQKFIKEYREFIKRKYPKIMEKLSSGIKLDPVTIKELEKTIVDFKKLFAS